MSSIDNLEQPDEYPQIAPDVFLYGENMPNEVVLYMKLAAASLNKADGSPTFTVIEEAREGYGAKKAVLLPGKSHVIIRGTWIDSEKPDAELERLADAVDEMMFDMVDVDRAAASHYPKGE